MGHATIRPAEERMELDMTDTPRMTVEPYHLHNCHSRQAWHRNQTKPNPCDCGLNSVLETLLNETERVDEIVRLIGTELVKELERTRHYPANDLSPAAKQFATEKRERIAQIKKEYGLEE